MNSFSYPWHHKQEGLIQEAIQANRLPHALLLSGEAGVGKLDFAKDLAATLLCEDQRTSHCGQCQSCLWFTSESHPDFYPLYQLEATIKIDMVREMMPFLQQKSHKQNGNKVILIALAEHMNQASANALLKALEEPGAKTYFILVSSNRGQLLPTIKSRCQMIQFPVSYAESTVQWLSAQGFTEEQSSKALAFSQGRPLLALTSLQDKDFFADFKQKQEDILQLLKHKEYQLEIAQRWQGQEILPLLDKVCWLIHNALVSKSQNNQLVMIINQAPQKWHDIYQSLIEIRRTVIDGYNLNKNLIVDKIMQNLGE